MQKGLIFLLLLISIDCFSLNATLGQVGERIVSTRDVEVHHMIVHALYHYKSKPKDLPFNKQDLQREVSSFMLEEMVYQEAKSFGLAKVSSKEIKRSSTKVLARILKSPLSSYWKKWGIETDELDLFVERNIRARRLISIKRKSAEVLVSDTEIDNYLKANAIKEEERNKKNYRDTVRSFLGRRQGEERLRQWFQVLKSKYEVKVF